MRIREDVIFCNLWPHIDKLDNIELFSELSTGKYRKVFINARITEETGNPWNFEEGCLSIPHVRGDVMRKPDVTIRYRDENWVEHTETFTGMPARIIQHEYDHIEGILFIDRLHALKRTMLKGKLQKISNGNIRTDYKMKFPK